MSTDDLRMREYLGDGLYAEWDGFQFSLHANNGIRDTNSVYLDLTVMRSFDEFVNLVKRKIEAINNAEV